MIENRSLLKQLMLALDAPIQRQIYCVFRQLHQNFFGPTGSQEKNAKKAFLAYHDRIRNGLPRERILEYNVDDGWQRLCDFLNVKVPTRIEDGWEVEVPFPNVDEIAFFLYMKAAILKRWRLRVGNRWWRSVLLSLASIILWDVLRGDRF